MKGARLLDLKMAKGERFSLGPCIPCHKIRLFLLTITG
jgi:hypothetical protein